MYPALSSIWSNGCVVRAMHSILSAKIRSITAVGKMLRPVYRQGSLTELIQTPHWDFLSLSAYHAWFDALPAEVRERIEGYWGKAEKSPWVIQRDDGVTGFVIPRLKLDRLVILPQPPRGEIAGDDEKKLFHDTSIPLDYK